MFGLKVKTVAVTILLATMMLNLAMPSFAAKSKEQKKPDDMTRISSEFIGGLACGLLGGLIGGIIGGALAQRQPSTPSASSGFGYGNFDFSGIMATISGAYLGFAIGSAYGVDVQGAAIKGKSSFWWTLLGSTLLVGPIGGTLAYELSTAEEQPSKSADKKYGLSGFTLMAKLPASLKVKC